MSRSRAFFIPFFLLLLSPYTGSAQEGDSSLSQFGLSLEIQEGIDPTASILYPGIFWNSGLHQLKLGPVGGPGYQTQAGARGSEWLPSRGVRIRGAALSYGIRIWQASERVELQGGLNFYYLSDQHEGSKGNEDPGGEKYSFDHRARIVTLAGAPFFNVEFDLGEGFALNLGFQPLRYRYSEFRWEPENGDAQEGLLREHPFFLQHFGVSYRP